MSREHTAQKPPAADIDLESFPRVPAGDGYRWRAHTAGRWPWFFANSSGRFDLEPPDGSCYVADDVPTAVRERFGELIVDTQAVTAERALQMRVSAVALPVNALFADVTDPSAVRYGVIREMCTMPDYSVPRAWAEAFHDAGADGVRYSSRFTSAPGPNAWAVFGLGGEDHGGVVHTGSAIPGTVACGMAGITVLPPAGPKSAFTVKVPGA